MQYTCIPWGDLKLLPDVKVITSSLVVEVMENIFFLPETSWSGGLLYFTLKGEINQNLSSPVTWLLAAVLLVSPPFVPFSRLPRDWWSCQSNNNKNRKIHTTLLPFPYSIDFMVKYQSAYVMYCCRSSQWNNTLRSTSTLICLQDRNLSTWKVFPSQFIFQSSTQSNEVIYECIFHLLAHWAALAQWGKRAVLQPQGCGFDPRSPH